MQVGHIGTFSNLSQFKDIKDFNNHIEQWMLDVKSKFTKGQLVALKRLIRFSAKVAGICTAKIGTIVSATHEKDGAGISRSTFKRMVSKAKEFGLLQVHETERKNGSQSANVYVFNRFESVSELSSEAGFEPPEGEKLNHQNKTDNPFKTNNKNNKKRTEDVSSSTKLEEPLNASFVSERVPSDFVSLVKYFFDDAKQIEEYWKLVKISAYKNKVTGDILYIALQAFRTLIRKLKFNKVTNTYGFYFGILNRKFKRLFLEQSLDGWWIAEV
ncbi:hypothetical protein P2R12_23210 [Cytobacillus oceanisediminis]|uniref:hypothetical protein n=1 Tax=Cytobacillus oceanisediminis TaxID=665099 RepID=UPI0023DB7E9D|nr:hypothetical protein [Cytobacillus oceanisediminis]MDF2039854.1 hypothetical protein [Cytobacillus oceanisediminis]